MEVEVEVYMEMEVDVEMDMEMDMEMEMEKRESTLAGIEVELVNSRRVYKWSGAMTLSCLAMEGTKNPEKCQFTQPVNSIELVAIEIIKVSENGFNSLNSVPVWKV